MTTVSPPSVLIVEDEPASLNMLASYFEAENFLVHKAKNAQEAEAQFEAKSVDVILLDIKIPGKTGLELIREFRARSNVGIILVTQKKDPVDKIVGLELGADDYVTKPYNARELLVRVKNLINRIKLGGSQQKNNVDDAKLVIFAEWTLHLGRRLLSQAGQEDIQLTEGEYKLLATLIENAGQVLNRDQIMNRMQRRDWFPTDRTIDVLIARLRKKLGDDRLQTRFINTAHGTGYIFVAEAVYQ